MIVAIHPDAMRLMIHSVLQMTKNIRAPVLLSKELFSSHGDHFLLWIGSFRSLLEQMHCMHDHNDDATNDDRNCIR
jgi:hypothetical protein